VATPDETFVITESDVDRWRAQIDVPDAEELEVGEVPDPPAGWSNWWDWAADRWPTLSDR